MAKKIRIGLSVKELDRAISEIEAYKADLKDKTEKLRQRIAEEVVTEAQRIFNKSIVDDVLKGERRTADVQVSADHSGNMSIVIAHGEDAVWVEFGAGVYHNGSTGASPHPQGAELGMTIGGYGEGHGKRRVWGFYTEDGGLTLTHGTRATMPMYNAMTTVCANIAQIAKEVFR